MILLKIILFFFLLTLAAITVMAQGYFTSSVPKDIGYKKVNNIRMPLTEEVYQPQIFRDHDNSPELIRKERISVEDIFYYSFNGTLVIDSVLRKRIYYNRNGDIEQIVIFNGNDTFSTSSILYNADYFPTLASTRLKGGNIHSEQFIEYQYDSLGLEKFVFSYNGDTSTLIIEEKFYDVNGQCIKIMRKINNRDFQLSNDFSYDSLGKLITSNTYTGVETLFEYKGIPLKELNVYQKAGKDKVKQEAFFFNEKMQIIKVIKWIVRTKLKTNDLKPLEVEQMDKESVSEFAYYVNGAIQQKVLYIENEIATIRRHYYKRL